VPSASRFNALILQHLDSVHAACNRLKPPFAVRDELISVGYEALVRASRRYDSSKKATFATFAFWPVRGAMLDCLAEQARWSARRASIFDEEEPLDTASPEVHQRTLTAQVLAAVEELPPRSRELIKGHYLQGNTLATVGKRHGLSKTRTTVHLARAIQQLRENLTDGFTEWPTIAKRPRRRFTDSFRSEVVRRAQAPAANIHALSRELGVAPATIHMWLKAGRRQTGVTRLAA